MSQFLANAGGLSMSRQDLDIIRQLSQEAQTVDDLEHRTTLEVCPAYGTLEKSVAREGNFLLGAIEGDGAA